MTTPKTTHCKCSSWAPAIQYRYQSANWRSYHREDSLEETGERYALFWKDDEPGNIRQHGIGFAIKTSLLRSMVETPVGISGYLMTWRIPLAKRRFATLVSAYTSTLDSSIDTEEEFWDSLNLTLDRVPKQCEILLLGDFSARVGIEHKIWTGMIGSHGTRNCNSNGVSRLTLCST